MEPHTEETNPCPICKGSGQVETGTVYGGIREMVACDCQCDHDWRLIQSWDGDRNVPRGTFPVSWLRCKRCGEEKELEGEDIEPEYPQEVDDE